MQAGCRSESDVFNAPKFVWDFVKFEPSLKSAESYVYCKKIMHVVTLRVIHWVPSLPEGRMRSH